MMTHASSVRAIDHHRLNKTIDVLAADLLKAQLLNLAHALQAVTNVRCVAGLFERCFQELVVQAITFLLLRKESDGGVQFSYCPDSETEKKCRLRYTLIPPEVPTEQVQAIKVEMDAICVVHTIKVKQRTQAFESASDTLVQVECVFFWSQLNWIVNKNTATPFGRCGFPRVLLHWFAGGQ